MSKLLVVVGATGTQGGAVIRWFQQHEPEWSIRALTRTHSSASALALRGSGVEVVQADLCDLASLQAAFRGAHYIFAFTDFAALMKDAVLRFHAGEIVAPVGLETYKMELRQGRNIALAAAAWPELERLVFSSAPAVKRLSKGRYEHVWHFDAKADALEFMLGSEGLRGKVSSVVMGVFVGNVVKIPHLWGMKLQDDVAVWSPPMPADLMIPWLDVEKDLGSFVAALFRAPAPTQVLCVSEWLSERQWLGQWTRATGIPSRLEPELSLHDHVDHDPTGLSRQFSETMKYIEDFGYTCGDPDVLVPEEFEERGISVQRTKVADYLAREDWSEVMGKEGG
ncbi:hypothetical protein LTR62_004818 [Meristemomyces frigidus]|uniref:NmrA-like domain-containing protein n=1 Tax=Meristemomyces frigidus TaxID=1508187 RepID=A0AAN7TF30_9PEZI|nr:hypothetical protein LTR62_004818 [Meristemomyces frigidus]